METAKGKTREDIINRLADRIDSYERYSTPHARIMAELAARLARRLGLTQPDINAVTEAALLHDIGLYAMGPAYHSLPDSLSFEERMDLWRHPIIGEQQMAKRDASRHSQLLVRWHHEWWNGTGYPDMLAFEDIPIGARLLRAVELYSALTSDRPYRAALSPERAIETLRSSAGVECDPYVVKALIALLDELSEEAGRAAAQTEEIQTEVAPAPDAAPDTGAVTYAGGTSAQGYDRLTAPDQAMLDRAGQQAETQAAADRGDEPPVSEAPHTSSAPRLQVSEPAAPAPGRSLPSFDWLISHADKEPAAEPHAEWGGWAGSRYNRKSLLGFEASVLRQIDFRSIAVAFSGWARLDWYLNTWGKLVLSNDPRRWAAAAARAMIESKTVLSEEQITHLLQDIYVPGTRFGNEHLLRWFGETDAWWMDNLRRSIDKIDDEALRAQALVLGLQTGDYALSFTDETRDLKRPLTTVFWRLAARALSGMSGHPHNRSYSQPVEEFIKRTRADLLYLTLPSAHAEQGGAEARNEWREAWVEGTDGRSTDDVLSLMTAPQSKHAYLALVERLLRAGSHIKTWAVGYQEVGLASARDITDLMKEYRPVCATYSKDLTEVVGGLHSYIIVAERV